MAETNILIVDDEQEIADLVEIYLVSDGYSVFKANDAQEGLDFREGRYSPGSSGHYDAGYEWSGDVQEDPGNQ